MSTANAQALARDAYLAYQAEIGTEEVVLATPYVRRASVASSSEQSRQYHGHAPARGPAADPASLTTTPPSSASALPEVRFEPMKPFVVPGAGAGPEFFGAIADQLARAERASALGSRRAHARPAALPSTPANTSSALAQSLAALKDLDAFWSWVDGEYPQWFPGTTAPVVRASGHGSPRLAVVELKPSSEGVFAGANGALLDRMMTAIGVTRDQMYLTSLLKSVPAPGAKALARKDIARMVPVLLRELQLAQCGLVLILGEPCAQAVLKTGRSIPELLRAPVETDGLSLSATWHPEEIRAADEAHAPPTGGKPERPRATQAWDHLQWVRGILPAR